MMLGTWLHITDRCNLRCPYCFLPHCSEDISVEIGRAAIDAVFRSVEEHNIIEVKFKYAGGEPLIRAEVVWALHRYALDQAPEHVEVQGVVLSNGVLLTPEIITQLQKHNLGLMISLDGLGDVQDQQRPMAGGGSSSAKVQTAIDMAIAHKLWPSISITVTGKNAAGLADLIAWLMAPERNSADDPEECLKFSINFFRENDCASPSPDLQLEDDRVIQGVLAAYKVIEQNLPIYGLLGGLADRANFTAAHMHTCGVGKNYLVFDHQGQVSKCQMAMNQPVTTIYNPDPLLTIREDTAGLQNPPISEKKDCAACRWKHWCGSCPLAAYRATGSYAAKSAYCNIYKAIFPELLKLEGLRLMKENGVYC